VHLDPIYQHCKVLEIGRDDHKLYEILRAESMLAMQGHTPTPNNAARSHSELFDDAARGASSPTKGVARWLTNFPAFKPRNSADPSASPHAAITRSVVAGKGRTPLDLERGGLEGGGSGGDKENGATGL
jgi:hypothetical protein